MGFGIRSRLRAGALRRLGEPSLVFLHSMAAPTQACGKSKKPRPPDHPPTPEQLAAGLLEIQRIEEEEDAEIQRIFQSDFVQTALAKRARAQRDGRMMTSATGGASSSSGEQVPSSTAVADNVVLEDPDIETETTPLRLEQHRQDPYDNLMSLARTESEPHRYITNRYLLIGMKKERTPPH